MVNVNGQKSFLHDSKAGKDTLGQITSYAAAQLGTQFQTHAFSVFILRDTARILQWDRSGTHIGNLQCNVSHGFGGIVESLLWAAYGSVTDHSI